MKDIVELMPINIDKLGTVEAASRRKLLKGTQHLMEENTAKSLSSYRPKLEKLITLKIEWKEWQKQLQKAGLDEKAAQQVQKESFKHKLLRNLKEDGGPFTSVEDVESYMRREISEKEKQKRVKMEVQYARATSVRMDQKDQLFKIMTVREGKRQTMSSAEFSENLRLYFGKTADQDLNQVDTAELFRQAIKSVNN